MISGVAFCPHPPVLLPEVATGAAPELDELRSACRYAIARVAVPGRQLVLLGPGPVSRYHGPHARGSFAGFGIPLEVSLGDGAAAGPLELPLSVSVGAWLVREVLGPDSGAVAFQIGPDFRGSPAYDQLNALDDDADVTLLVLGDGSACRSTAAPGYLDERAAEFDARVADALRRGEGWLLRQPSIDVDGIGAALLCRSVPMWDEVAGRTEATKWKANLRYDAAPYGVGYFVAAWT